MSQRLSSTVLADVEIARNCPFCRPAGYRLSDVELVFDRLVHESFLVGAEGSAVQLFELSTDAFLGDGVEIARGQYCLNRQSARRQHE